MCFWAVITQITATGHWIKKTGEVTPITIIIVSITKFLTVIGSPCTYLSCNRQVITWVSDYRYLITTFCNSIPVIGYPEICISTSVP